VIGAPNLGDDPRDDVEGRRDWWVDERGAGGRDGGPPVG
jgi:hypothetical protein